MCSSSVAAHKCLFVLRWMYKDTTTTTPLLIHLMLLPLCAHLLELALQFHTKLRYISRESFRKGVVLYSSMFHGSVFSITRQVLIWERCMSCCGPYNLLYCWKYKLMIYLRFNRFPLVGVIKIQDNMAYLVALLEVDIISCELKITLFFVFAFIAISPNTLTLGLLGLFATRTARGDPQRIP